MAELNEWETAAKRLLRAEMARRGFTYAKLVEELNKRGAREEEHNLRNKVARGKFTAAFLLQCLAAMGCKQVRLDE